MAISKKNLLAALVCGTCLSLAPVWAQTVDVQSSIRRLHGQGGKRGHHQRRQFERGHRDPGSGRRPDAGRQRARAQGQSQDRAKAHRERRRQHAPDQRRRERHRATGRYGKRHRPGRTGHPRSADSTAHKTVLDPNDQLGTSLEGRTKPVTQTPDQTVQAEQN